MGVGVDGERRGGEEVGVWRLLAPAAAPAGRVVLEW
mgnify:CR=1 FL=1